MSIGEKWLRLAREGPSGPAGWLAYGALSGLSAAYRLGLEGKRAIWARGLRKAYRAPIPIISVGNLTLGGTGKTPFCAMLARVLTDLGHRPAVVLRGYGGSSTAACDEQVMLQGMLPSGALVLAGRNRKRSIIAATEDGATVALLDDGHQHVKVHRDLRIVLFDATRPGDLRAVFPVGLLREPLSHLSPDDVVCLTRCDQATEQHIQAILSRLDTVGLAGDVLRAAHSPQAALDTRTGQPLSLAELTGRRVMLVSGIGNNDAFAASAKALGVEVARHLTYPDHHRYTERDGLRIRAEVRSRRVMHVLTTEKDAPRLGPVLPDTPILLLQVRLDLLEGWSLLEERLQRIAPPPSEEDDHAAG